MFKVAFVILLNLRNLSQVRDPELKTLSDFPRHSKLELREAGLSGALSRYGDGLGLEKCFGNTIPNPFTIPNTGIRQGMVEPQSLWQRGSPYPPPQEQSPGHLLLRWKALHFSQTHSF